MNSENVIELKLQGLNQLFNTMDPSPFHEKDLDHDAEEFMVSWAREHPIEEPLRLVVHLANPPTTRDPQTLIAQAIHHYFAYRAELTRRELRQLLRSGRISLMIGLSFLAVCVSSAEVLDSLRLSGMNILKESLTIGGWVAMWHPMEVFLYDWWPLGRTVKIYRKLSTLPIDVMLFDPRRDSTQA